MKSPVLLGQYDLNEAVRRPERVEAAPDPSSDELSIRSSIRHAAMRSDVSGEVYLDAPVEPLEQQPAPVRARPCGDLCRSHGCAGARAAWQRPVHMTTTGTRKAARRSVTESIGPLR